MLNDRTTVKLFGVAFIGGLCLVASFLVMGLVYERESRFKEVQQEVAKTWGEAQVIVGPVLINNAGINSGIVNYILPDTLNYQVKLEPEVRSRGIFKSVVYVAKLSGSGSFSAKDISDGGGPIQATFSLGITDTRGIEKQFDLEWDKTKVALNPGAGNNPLISSSGLSAQIPDLRGNNHTFSFEVTLNGSEGIQFLPLGRETEVKISSPWENPKFMGNYLPSERNVAPGGFDSVWRVSSFGRTYPQVITQTNYPQPLNQTDRQKELIDSSFGVSLLGGVDLYTQVIRSIKYAILFIATTFIVFALFELLSGLRIHPVQYLLVGVALAMFYLLLLSLAEHIGFGLAYLISMLMVALLVSVYCYKVLGSMKRTLIVFGALELLYGYLYFNLSMEDYALLFGSLFLFTLLAVIMYLTRNIDWYNLQATKNRS